MQNSEIDVKFIWDQLSDFWNYFQDRETVEQVWRAYLQSISNLYYQLYQISLSKSVDTVRDTWISDWEKIVFDRTTSILNLNDDPLICEGFHLSSLSDVDTIDFLVEYGYLEYEPEYSENAGLEIYKMYDTEGNIHFVDIHKEPNPENPDEFIEVCRPWRFEYNLKDGIKDITFLLETPRNGVRLSRTDKIKPNGLVGHTDGSERIFPTAVYDNIEGYPTPTVENGYLIPGQFIIVETQSNQSRKLCAYTKLPPFMWAHLAIRDSYNLYNNFGYLLRFFKEDSLEYLREIQGLWLSYFSSPTIAAIQRGLTILSNLPFALNAGVVTALNITSPSLVFTHANPIYIMDPGENAVQTFHSNDTYNPYNDHPLPTDHPIRNSDGILRESYATATLPAQNFVRAGAQVNDYIYSLDNNNRVATLVSKREETVAEFPAAIVSLLHTDCLITKFSHSADYNNAYLILDYRDRIELSQEDARSLEDRKVREGLTITKIEDSNVTLSPLYPIQLDDEHFWELFVGDTITFISPAQLDITIGNNNYTYITACEPTVSVGQYIEKYTPLVEAVRVIDYLKRKNWVLESRGLDPDKVSLSEVFKGRMYDIGNLHYDEDLIYDGSMNNAFMLQAIADLWHTFLIEEDEDAAPDSYDTLKLYNAFVREVKPTYTNSQTILQIEMEDDYVWADQFEVIDAKYTFQDDYPWGDHNVLVYDELTENNAPARHYDQGYLCDEHNYADDFEVFVIADQEYNEDFWASDMISYDTNYHYDGNFVYDTNTRDEFEEEVVDAPDYVLPVKTIKIGKPVALPLYIYNNADIPSRLELIINTNTNTFILTMTITSTGDNSYLLSSNVPRSVLESAADVTLELDDLVFNIDIS